MTVTGIRAVAALRASLDALGLSRTSGYNGGEMTGWTSRHGSTGFSIRADGEGLHWHVVVSGKPHLRYRSYQDRSGDETYDLHEPTNPESLYPRIRQAMAAIGLQAIDVRNTGHQTMWDDDVDYTIVTAHPDWLEKPDARNAGGLPPTPTLVALSTRHLPLPFSAFELAGYADGGKLFLTKESVEACLAAFAQRSEELRRIKMDTGDVALGGDGCLTLRSRDGFRFEGKPRTVTNFWGDDVEVVEIPREWFAVDARSRLAVPALVSGTLRTDMTFAELDAQYDDGAPWHPVTQQAPAPGR